MLLHFVGYCTVAIGFFILVLCLACGLYILAEWIEEHTVYTKKIIKALTIFVVILQISLCLFDRLPALLSAFSIFCHFIYSLNLKNFPFIKLTGLPFISSCILVFVDHFLWFNYFTVHYRPFRDIATFFILCVWLVPFTLFTSLSANDNTLPTNMDSGYVDSIPNQQKQGLFKTLLNTLGIKSQEPALVTAIPKNDNFPTRHSFSPPSTIGLASSTHYSYSNKDVQNRKFM